MSGSELVLHVWPSQWGLSSFEPSCLAAIMYLQLSIPGKFSVAECSDSSLSPTGQFPFLTHEQHRISSFASIIKYVASLKTTEVVRTSPNLNLDAPLSSTERSQTAAWCAHVESNLGDLVAYTLYSNHKNWAKLTHPALVSMSFLYQRYYVPNRIRDMYKPRLELAGLWDLSGKDDEELKKKFKEDKIKPKDRNAQAYLEAFSREKVLEKARASLEIYARLVGGGDFIYQDRPTSLDVFLAAHILLLLEPEFPDSFMQNLIRHTYPTLASHAQRVLRLATSSPESHLKISRARKFALNALLPWPRSLTAPSKPKLSEEDLHFRRMRWGFYGLTLGSLAVYLVTSYRAAYRRGGL